MDDDWSVVSSSEVAAPERARRLPSAAGALLVHALLAAALLLRPPALVAGLPSVRINLVSSGPGETAATGTGPSPTSTSESALADMAHSLSDGTASTSAPAANSRPGATDLAGLLGEVASEAPDGRGKATPAARGGAAAGAEGDKLDLDPFGHAALSYADGKPTEPVALWPEIDACWKTTPGAPPVIVRVTLNELGQLAGKPRPLRPALARLTPDRAAAETRAIEALKGCAPYALTPARRPGRPYDLDFR